MADKNSLELIPSSNGRMAVFGLEFLMFQAPMVTVPRYFFASFTIA